MTHTNTNPLSVREELELIDFDVLTYAHQERTEIERQRDIRKELRSERKFKAALKVAKILPWEERAQFLNEKYAEYLRDVCGKHIRKISNEPLRKACKALELAFEEDCIWH